MSEKQTEKNEVKIPEVEVVEPGSIEEVVSCIRASLPLLFVTTHDEREFINELYNICSTPEVNRLIYTWSAYQGIVPLAESLKTTNLKRASGDFAETWNPTKALQAIDSMPRPQGDNNGLIFILKDFHTVLGQPIPRQLRDMYKYLSGQRKTIIMLGGQLAHGPGAVKPGMEPSLDKQVTLINYTLPSRKAAEKYIRHSVLGIKNSIAAPRFKKLDYTDEEYYKFSRACQGLTYYEMESAISLCLRQLRELDVERLMREKKQIIMKSEILEYIESKATLDSIGGMDNAKKYFQDHTNSHTEDAEAFGVEPLKGVLLTGIPGTGKSVLSKAVGNYMGLPTLRLDVGKVMTGLVGGSEQKMREVLNQCQSVAPCLLWIDEIEKALSGTKSSNFSDGGTLSRVFGTLLTGMEEGLKGVTIIATANDITQLPPELIRRFNEVFFVDLPTDEERAEIFTIHLTKRKRDPKNFDMKALIKVTDKYTGAEIEKAIKEAIARAFNEGKRPITTEDLVTAVEETKPISTVMDDKINAIRKWARDRARYASSSAAEAAGHGKQKVKTKSGKTLSIDEAVGDMDLKKKTSDDEVGID